MACRGAVTVGTGTGSGGRGGESESESESESDFVCADIALALDQALPENLNQGWQLESAASGACTARVSMSLSLPVASKQFRVGPFAKLPVTRIT